MSTNRVVLGVQNDGHVGLRVSAVGVDADVGDGQGGDFTFNSDWTDISKLYQIGYVSYVASGCKRYDAAGTANFTEGGWGALYTSLGYRPFVEARRVNPSTNTINDDYWDTAQIAGSGVYAWYDCLHARNAVGGTQTDKMLYSVFRISCPFPGGTW